jgi:hypothetical protein
MLYIKSKGDVRVGCTHQHGFCTRKITGISGGCFFSGEPAQ